MRRIVTLLLKSKTGATAIEYGLIAALVAIAAIGGMQALGGSLQTIFGGVGGILENAIPDELRDEGGNQGGGDEGGDEQGGDV
ncbi:Flp family type IVb pilin [Algihabitans albus]|uniref:Flp family type IVb pilin n=1 Tax=Algihabitans albus TaxID=2164067 RepID=UPI0035D1383E